MHSNEVEQIVCYGVGNGKVQESGRETFTASVSEQRVASLTTYSTDHEQSVPTSEYAL